MLKTLIKCWGKLPLRVSYTGASATAWLLRDVVRYRRKVVEQNLRSSFPEKDEREIRRLSRRFYHFMADCVAETIAAASMSEEEMRERMTFENMEEVDKILNSGRDVSLYLGHYGNWEWCASIPLWVSARCRAMEVYHPLANRSADEAMLMIRSRFGGQPVAMADTLRAIVGSRREGIPSFMGYIADQGPLYESTHLFIDFLNHADTPVLTGAEKISRRLKAAAFYCDVERIGRGRYRGRMVKLCDDASLLPEFELTRRYFAALEQTIRRAPEYWLWSHRRWKRTLEEFCALFGPEEAQRRRETL